MVTMPLGQAVSDTDVYLIKAEEVTFEEEKITIVGSARIKMRVIKDNRDPAYRGHQIWGRPAAWVFAKADKAAFVIHKPKPPIIRNENLRPKNYEEGIPLTAFGGGEHRGGIQTAERPRGRIPFRADGLRPLHRSHP